MNSIEILDELRSNPKARLRFSPSLGYHLVGSGESKLPRLLNIHTVDRLIRNHKLTLCYSGETHREYKLAEPTKEEVLQSKLKEAIGLGDCLVKELKRVSFADDSLTAFTTEAWNKFKESVNE